MFCTYHLLLRNEILLGMARVNIGLMGTKRHMVWGGVVGALVAIAFNVLLTLQFDAELTIGFAVVTVPICAIFGAGFGWAWWRWFAR